MRALNSTARISLRVPLATEKNARGDRFIVLRAATNHLVRMMYMSPSTSYLASASLMLIITSHTTAHKT